MVSSLSLTPTPKQMSTGTRLSLAPPFYIVAGRDVPARLRTSVEDIVSAVFDGDSAPAGSAGQARCLVLVGRPDGDGTIERYVASAFSSVSWRDLEAEGYCLALKGVEGKTVLWLCGADERGLHFAVRSLASLMAREMPELEIVDAPRFKIRGVIEGFYGRPWSQRAREDMLDFLAEYKFNTYVYGPKEDPYHREKWREPYPPSRFRGIKRLVKKAQDNLVDFAYSVGPGLSLVYSSDEDLNLLCKKYDAFCELGVRWFGLFFDDIPFELQHEQDGRRFADVAEAQVYFTNRVYQFLKDKDPASKLVFCPTEYAGRMGSAYLRKLGSDLPGDIEFISTGPTICSPSIPDEHGRRVAEVIRRKPLYWDNYPVNDAMMTGQLHIGPVDNRDRELWRHASGLLSNPMNQAEASKIPLITIAEYLWNPEAYEPTRSWDAAAETIGGRDALPHLQALAENCRTSCIRWDAAPTPELIESPILVEKIEGFWQECDRGEIGSAFRELSGEFNRLEASAAFLLKELANSKLRREIRPWVTKLSLLAQAGSRVLQALEGIRFSVYPSERVVIRKAVAETVRLRKHAAKNPKETCRKVVEDFLDRVLSLL